MSTINLTELKLIFAALIPVFATVVLHTLTKNTRFGHLPRHLRSVIYGVIFGAIAIIGTEWGIPMNGAQVNCRDAAVLTAGLLFGAPAGIIAGFIGGIERWIAVAWGVGSFTRVACTVSTVIAGFYAAALRKHMFEDKKPGWFIALAIGIVMEVFHLTMVFLTNMATPEAAMAVVRACAVPMILANGISVMLSAFFVALLSGEVVGIKREAVRISKTVQRWLLVAVAFAFFATSLFVFRMQDELSSAQTDSLLSLALSEIAADIRDTSDRHLLDLTHNIADDLSDYDTLSELAEDYEVSEISLVDESGHIYDSTETAFLGFDMASGGQSRAFLCLLNGETEYVQGYGAIAYDKSVMRKYAGVSLENGFVQVGYNASQFQHDIDNTIAGVTKNRHVGKTGFILIFDEKNNVVSAPLGFSADTLREEAKDIVLPEPDLTFSMTVNGEPSFCRYRVEEGFYILSVLPQAEALQLRNISLYVNTFMEVLVFAVLFALIYLLIKKVVVDQIKTVNRSLAKITAGDLDEVVNVRSNEEFAMLSDDINSTVDTLKRYIAEASARIDEELEFAKSIQVSALPRNFPKRPDLDLFASMTPAREVGGDFYDFYFTERSRLHFLIADVSGKGIPAAMFMMRAKTELKTLTEAELPVGEVFTRGNHALCEGNDAGMFVTAWQGGIDLATGVVQFANAGHNPPLVRRGNGKFEYVRTRAGFVLAGMDDILYKMQDIQLAPGDCIYLYTDGVTEATDSRNELYGEERLLAAVNAKEFADMEELCRFVRADVDAFVGEAPQFDDMTMLALRYIGQN